MNLARFPFLPSQEPPTLTDGVVVLDGFRLADSEALLARADDEIAARLDSDSLMPSIGAMKRAILRWDGDWLDDAPRRALAVRRAAGCELVGGVELRLRLDDPEIAEVSHWTFELAQRDGYATRALRLVSGFAFDELGVMRLELYVEPDDIGSRKVARGAGFVAEGLARRRTRVGPARRDMVVYAQVRSDG
jgi:RimJ/RimL family protein N-acetyltransferase